MIYKWSEAYGAATSSIVNNHREYHLRMYAETGADTIDTASAVAYFADLIAPTVGSPTIVAESGLSLANIDASEVATIADGTGFVTEGLYRVDVDWDYQAVEIQELNTVRTSSRSAAVAIRVKASKSIGAEYTSAGSVTPSDNTLVNVVDGEPEGLDVLYPTTVFTATAILLPATVNQAYEVATQGIVGKVNSTTYRGRAAGTLLCSGVNIGEVSSNRIEVAAEFMYEPNVTGLQIGDITGIGKGGWQYLEAISSGGVPTRVRLHNFYDTADFAAALGF